MSQHIFHLIGEDCPIRFNTTQIGDELYVSWEPFECRGWEIATFAGNLSCMDCEDVTPFSASSANISFGLANVKRLYTLCVIAENVCGERTTMQCSSITGKYYNNVVSFSFIIPRGDGKRCKLPPGSLVS